MVRFKYSRYNLFLIKFDGGKKMDELTMKKILENAKTQKISHNINEKTLEMVDGLSKITGTTRTQMLDAVIVSGIKAQTNFIIKHFEKLKKDKKFEDKKRKIEELLGKVKEFKKKWTIGDIPS